MNKRFEVVAAEVPKMFADQIWFSVYGSLPLHIEKMLERSSEEELSFQYAKCAAGKGGKTYFLDESNSIVYRVSGPACPSETAVTP